MHIGLVCPYSFDVPGGVQLHIRDLAEYLIGRGHKVSVLAPADEETELPAYVVSAGRAVPVRYNGSVARLAFGPIVANRVQAWLDEHDFDVLHLHEPAAPSLSLLTLWAAEVPVVATFHSSQSRSVALRAAQPLLQPGLDKISARIAVSESAHDTMAAHVGGTTVCIPNGVYVDRFCPGDDFVPDRGAHRVVFLGRFGEPRKGLPVLLAALPLVLAQVPDAEVLVVGPGDVRELRSSLSPQLRDAVRFLGMVSEEEKVSLLAGANAYIAPNTGGESFGIILVEAMSAGAPVIASSLDAFTAVIGDQDAGVIFPVGDHRALAAEIVRVLEDPDEQDRLRAAGRARAQVFDWSSVGARIEAVYDSVTIERDEATRAAEREARTAAPSRRSRHGPRVRVGRGASAVTEPSPAEAAGPARTRSRTYQARAIRQRRHRARVDGALTTAQLAASVSGPRAAATARMAARMKRWLRR